MKIILLRTRGETFNTGDKLYAVMAQFNNKKWGFADFLGLPYTSKGFEGADSMMLQIIKKASEINSSLWTRNKFRVAKIEL